MQKNFISFLKKKVKKGLQEMVLLCLVWIEVCFTLEYSRVERDLEKAQDVEVYSV